MLRRVQQNDEKGKLREALVCVLLTLWFPSGMSLALLIVPSLPEDPFPKPLQASRDNDESRRLKQMVTEPFLS